MSKATVTRKRISVQLSANEANQLHDELGASIVPVGFDDFIKYKLLYSLITTPTARRTSVIYSRN